MDNGWDCLRRGGVAALTAVAVAVAALIPAGRATAATAGAAPSGLGAIPGPYLTRKGAEGPMQFEPATFAEYAVRADRSRKLSPFDPEDAIFAAARMLCSDGGGRARGLKGAIFAYNHARWYVRDVLALAARYTAAARRDRPRRARRRVGLCRSPF
jgi:transglycosylase-like protein with SLT domain